MRSLFDHDPGGGESGDKHFALITRIAFVLFTIGAILWLCGFRIL
jgi:hypothetical protein